MRRGGGARRDVVEVRGRVLGLPGRGSVGAGAWEPRAVYAERFLSGAGREALARQPALAGLKNC